MKIFNFFYLLSFLFIFSCNSSNSGENLVKNPIKMEGTHYYSVKIEKGEAFKDTLRGCSYCNQTIIFDKNGRELENRFYKPNMNDMFAIDVYRYNSDGFKIGSYYYVNDTLVTEYNYELNSKNQIAKVRAYDIATQKLNYGYDNKYDKNGNHIETGNVDSGGKIYEFYRRKFNENGIVRSETIEDLEGNVQFNVRYEYRPKVDSSWVEQLTYYNEKLAEIRFKEKILFK